MKYINIAIPIDTAVLFIISTLFPQHRLLHGIKLHDALISGLLEHNNTTLSRDPHAFNLAVTFIQIVRKYYF